jgi:Fe-S oxidoreductase
MAALGTLVLTLTAAVLAAGFVQGRLPAGLMVVACIAILVGAAGFVWRRARRGTLSWQKSLATLGLLIYAASLTSLGVRLADGGTDSTGGWLAYLIVAGGLSVVYVAAFVEAGPLRHAFAGFANLAFHSRPQRFAETVERIVPKPIDLAAPVLGVRERSNFAWNELIAFDACVECRRCEDVCPAHAAGSPLNPMALIGALRRADDNEELIGSAISADALWACTTCGACVEACPMFIEHVDAIVDLRRSVTLERGETPKVSEWIEQLSAWEQAAGRPLPERLTWASDLQLRRLGAGEHTAVLLWVGDAGFMPEGQRALRALVQILRSARVEFAVLPEEGDVGDTALRLGAEHVFRELAEANAQRLDAVTFERILTLDPHVVQAFAADYLAIGRRWDVVHHTTFLEELMARDQWRPGTSAGGAVLTFHDPCYLGRYGGEYESPRALLKATGASLVEMRSSRQASFCCGYGGGAALTDVPSKRRIPDLRVEQARVTNARTLVVACPNCSLMLGGSAAGAMEVVEISEWLARSSEKRQ